MPGLDRSAISAMVAQMKKVKRSHLMLVASYYLARCGEPVPDGPAGPPAALGVSTWNDAYDLFYDAMGDGRIPSQFRRSMYTARVDFDPLFDNGRTGWAGWNPDRKLPAKCAQIHEEWKHRSDQELETFVLASLMDPVGQQIVPLPITRTEGARKSLLQSGENVIRN